MRSKGGEVKIRLSGHLIEGTPDEVYRLIELQRQTIIRLDRLTQPKADEQEPSQ